MNWLVCVGLLSGVLRLGAASLLAQLSGTPPRMPAFDEDQATAVETMAHCDAGEVMIVHMARGDHFGFLILNDHVVSPPLAHITSDGRLSLDYDGDGAIDEQVDLADPRTQTDMCEDADRAIRARHLEGRPRAEAGGRHWERD